MKKILAWLLLLTLVVGLFAGCKQTGTETPTTAPQEEVTGSAQDAIDYLKAYYTDNGAQTPIDYTRFGIVRIGGVPYDVVWTTDAPEDLIKIVKNEDGTYTIDINEDAAEDTEYTLTATVTDAQGNTATHSWNYILPKAQDMVAIVEAAYALENGESLPYESRLRGKVISIDSIYTEDYQNITVTIEIAGAEDKPIKCYRMKGTTETLALLPDVKVGNIITVTGTLKNYQGTIEFDSGCLMIAWEKGDAVEAPTDPGEILKAAYALQQDQVLPYVATLTGTVTEIDTPYDPAYGNISVEIVVDGYPQYPILCYRLKGLGVDQIAVNDLITVSGIIKNYKGTIEYDSGCQMTNRVSGGGVAQGPSSDPNKIIPDALKLNPGEKLPYRATLTGEIISVDNAYDAAYGNVTVTIKVNGYKFQCYRMVGDGVDQIRETDTITVSGIIENYNGKLEFGAKCNLDSWTKGPRNVNYGPITEGVAYKLYIDQKSIDKTVYFDGSVSGTRLGTTTTGSKGVDVYGEIVSGKGVLLYYMNGETKTYLGIEEYTNDSGKQRGRAVVTTEPIYHWVYNADVGVYVVNLPTAGKYFLGTYSTYDNISASWIGYVDGSMTSTSAQYITNFIRTENLPADEPGATGTSTIVTAPEVGVAYKLGHDQLAKQEIYYFNGKMSGYYGGTDTDATKGIDVYLENAEGGYKVYFTDGNGVKQYLLIAVGDDGTHINFKFSNSSASVFVFDTEHNSLYTTLDDGSVHYMGTNGTYVTVNTIRESNKDKEGYYLTHLYITTGSGGPSAGATDTPDTPDTPDVPGATATVVDTPVVDTAYKFGLDKGDGKVLYFTGNTESSSVTYRLETSEDATKAVDVYLETAEGGYYLYFMKDGVKTYIRMYHRTDGDPGYGKGSLEFVAAAPSEVMTYDETAKTLFYDYDGNNAYYMGTYGTYVTMSVSNTSYITGDDAGNVDVSQFPARFYTVEISEPETSEPGTTEPSGTVATVVDTPVVDTAYKFGLNKGDGKVLYFTGNTESSSVTYRLETSEDATKAVDVYLETAEGGYYLYFMKDGVKTYINVFHRTDGDPGYGKGSLELVTATPSNVYTYDETAKTLVYDYDGNNAYYMGTYGTYVTMSVSNTSYITGDDAGNVDVSQFPARFYTVEAGEPGTTEPGTTEPGTTEPGTTEPAGEFGVGSKIVIVNSHNGKYLAVSDNANAPVEVTVSGGTVNGVTEAITWEVCAGSASGKYTLKNTSTNTYISWESGSSYTLGASGTDLTITLGEGSSKVNVASDRGLVLRLYNGAYRFRMYQDNDTNKSDADYSFVQTIYVIGGSTGEPGTTEPGTTEPAPTEPAPTVPGEVPDGSVAIYIPKDGKVMTTTVKPYNGKDQLATAAATLSDGKVTTSAADVLLVTIVENADGTVSFKTADGKYLHSDGTHTNLSATANDNTEFVLEEVSGGYYVRLANFKYQGTKDQYLEYYKEIVTCYGMGSDAGMYTFAFYPVGEGGSTEPPVTEPDTTEPGTTEPSNPGTSDGLKVGDKIVIVNSHNGKYLAVSDDANAPLEVTVSGGTVNGVTAAITWEVCAGSASGKYILKNTSTNTYISWSSGSSYTLGTSGTDLTITLGEGSSKVNVASDRGLVLRLYKGEYRFRMYQDNDTNKSDADYSFVQTIYVVG